MYLLLRNNKQTGPFSAEELKSMGLKAYDLVWSEGKSAAWRYPSEIEELKAFAPAVEEQPFDRFYRRPATAGPATSAASQITTSQITTAANQITTAGDTTAATTTTAPIPVAVESAKTPGKRIIYVTMPAARNTSTITYSNTSVTTPQREPIRETTATAPRETATVTSRETAASREAAPAYAAREIAQPIHTGPRVIEDYAARQIGDQALVEELFPRKKRSPRAMRLLIIGICILALLAAGIIIGLNLNKDTLGLPAKVVARIPPTNTDQAIVHPTAQALPVPAATTPATPADQTNAADSVPAIVEQSNATPAVVSKPTVKPSTTRTQKEKPVRSTTQPNSLNRAKDSAASGSLTNTIHRADVAEPRHDDKGDNTVIADKETVKANLISQVSVGASGYSVGTFGGITDLQLTVTNRSAYPLELVIVEVQYIQANKKVFKTENLYFRGIAAGAALMQEAPKSSRGVKVQYKITSITGKDGLSYSGIN